MGFHTCAPNEVMVISGAGYVRPQLVSGGRVWVWGWQKLQRYVSVSVSVRLCVSVRASVCDDDDSKQRTYSHVTA